MPMKFIGPRRVTLYYTCLLTKGCGWCCVVQYGVGKGQAFHKNKFTAYREALEDLSLTYRKSTLS